MALENQRYGRNKDILVNKTYIESGEYRRKFDNVTDSQDERAVIYTDKIKSMIKKHENLITIHTHPGSMPPSIADFNSNYIDEASKACRNLFAIFCGCRVSGEQNGALNKLLLCQFGKV